MANFYNNYHINDDFNQVNLYDHNHYQFGYDPVSYNWNESESQTTSASVAYSGYDPVSYNCYNWNDPESQTTSASVAYSGYDPMSYNCYNWNESESETTSAPVAYSGYDQMSYNWNESESHATSVSLAYSGYDPMSYNWNGSETETTSAYVAYSVSTMSEPKHLFYDPNLYTTYESPPQFRIHYSVASALDFNEPEFDDYDPTPYGGGYDVVANYGKPLPPSVEICYPCSNAPHDKAPSPPEIITPVPLGIYEGGEKKLVKKRVTFAEPVEESRPMQTIKEAEDDDEEENEEEEDDDKEEEEDHSSGFGNEKPEIVDKEEEEEDQSSGFGSEKPELVNEEEEEDYSAGYGNEKPEIVEKEEVKALYVPSGYGLEATDLCEVIFGGYFPCVLRNKRREQEEAAEVVSCWESNDTDPWKTTSDYLFGDSYPYGYENRTERNQFEISSYGYRRY